MKQVTDAVVELPEPYAATVLHRYLDGLSTEETAKRMGVPPATVRKRLSRAITMLREHLEHDTGVSVENWAGLLLLSGGARPPTFTAIASAGLMKGLLVAHLSKLVFGAAAVALVATLWHIDQSEPVEAEPSLFVDQDDSASLAQPDRPELATLRDEDARSSPLERPRREAAVTASPSEEPDPPPFELRVSVADGEGRPVTNGNLLLRSSPDASPEFSRKSRLRRVDITGEVTRVPFSVAPESVTVRASIPGAEPVPGVTVLSQKHMPRTDGAGTYATAHIVLGTQFEGPSVYGRVFVGGTSRIPRDLRINPSGRGYLASVSENPARYELGPVRSHGEEERLIVTSEETVPLAVSIRVLESHERLELDLHLELSASLEVQVLDALTDAPLEGVELVAEIFFEQERSGRVSSGSNHRVVKTSDIHGLIVYRGLPRVGSVEIQAWQDRYPPLARVKLTADSPDPLRLTVRIESRTTRFLGQLAPSLAMDSARGRVLARSTGGYSIGSDNRRATIDSEGRWSFEVPLGSSWQAWFSVDGERRSRVLALEAHTRGELGPYLLEAANAYEVRLVVEGVEEGRALNVIVKEDGGGPAQQHKLSAGAPSRELVLILDGPATVFVAYDEDHAEKSASVQRHVDPVAESEIHFDLSSFVRHGATVLMDGELPSGESLLVLLNTKTLATGQHLSQWLSDGRSSEEFVVAAGRYVWMLISDERPGIIGGIVEVGDASGELRLIGASVPHDLTELGVGIRLVTIGNFSFGDAPAGLAEFRWPEHWQEQAGGQVRLPADLEFEILR